MEESRKLRCQIGKRRARPAGAAIDGSPKKKNS